MPPARKAAAAVARFGRDERGFVLAFFAVAIPALLGLVGLALDGARFLSLDTELAGASEAAALAAARSLDRSPGAIPQARAAARALAAGSATPSGARLTFRFAAELADLRRSPTFTLADEAGAEAVYVEVRTAPTALALGLLGLVGRPPPALSRRAIAESQYYACDVTPAVMCHPEPDVFVAQARPGRQYLLRMDGNTVAGSIALLDRPDAPNERQVVVNLASEAPRFCYAAGTRLRTNVAPSDFDAALNTRFDRYVGRAGPIAPDLAAFPPAPNIIQGRHLDSCVAVPEGGDIYPPYGLPRDGAYRGFKPTGPWNAGGGDWATAPPVGGAGFDVRTGLDEYLAWNHADKGPVIQDRLRSAPTRYDLYLAELGRTRQTQSVPVDTRGLGPSRATMPTGGPSGGALALRRESPIPICYAGPRSPTDARRRIIYLAIADCARFPPTATAAVLSRRIGKFFLTEPSDAGATLVEFAGMVRPTDDDGKLRHVVQLVDVD